MARDNEEHIIEEIFKKNNPDAYSFHWHYGGLDSGKFKCCETSTGNVGDEDGEEIDGYRFTVLRRNDDDDDYDYSEDAPIDQVIYHEVTVEYEKIEA